MPLRKSILPPISYDDKTPFQRGASKIEEESFGDPHKKLWEVLSLTLTKKWPISLLERTYIKENERTLDRKEKQIRDAVEKGDVTEARKLISQIPLDSSKALDGWRKALAEPKATIKGPASGSSLKLNIEWVKNNSDQYKGQWVALKDGKLLGHHLDRHKLLAELKCLNQLKGALLFKVKE
jgi:hypothetical protein